MPSLDSVLSCPNLPSLPTVAIRVLELAECERVDVRDIERVVQNDPALVGKILKTVNSSYYGLSRRCPTIGPALTYLGLNTVKSLVLGFSLVDLTRRQGAGVDLLRYWQRCLYSAAAARRIATAVGGSDPEEAFTAALMQDIGMLAMDTALGPEYAAVLQQAGEDHERLPELEQDLLGFDHCRAGARLAEKWQLPAQLIESIASHHNLSPPAGPNERLMRTVALSCRTCIALAAECEATELKRLEDVAGRLLGIEARRLHETLLEARSDASELAGLFRVHIGELPDVGALLVRAEEARLLHHIELQRQTESLQQANRQLTQEAMTDALTGVGNRKHFDVALQKLFAAAGRTDKALALLVIDVDHFKGVNDEHGHPAGDRILVELARRFQQIVYESGLVCRYGGEEFAVLLPGADRSRAAQIAEALRHAVEEIPFDLHPAATASLPITVSIGAAVIESASAGVLSTERRLLLAADKALYAAKRAGRNCVRVFRPRGAPQ